MGSIRFLLALAVLVCLGSRNCYSQTQEAEQLVLNVEKLSQLKNILSDMKKGYEVVAKGYGTVKNIAQGNFSLHEAFLDGLWLVSPQVRKYYKVAEIISQQKSLVQEYKSAFKRFQRSKLFSAGELEYLAKVYAGVLAESVDHLDQLAMVITAKKMRMSDQERLEAIDRIYLATGDKLDFLRSFNRQNSVLALQREREQADNKGLVNYYKSN